MARKTGSGQDLLVILGSGSEGTPLLALLPASPSAQQLLCQHHLPFQDSLEPHAGLQRASEADMEDNGVTGKIILLLSSGDIFVIGSLNFTARERPSSLAGSPHIQYHVSTLINRIMLHDPTPSTTLESEGTCLRAQR